MAFMVVACLFCLIALAGGIRVDRAKALKELKAWKATKAAAGAAPTTGTGEAAVLLPDLDPTKVGEETDAKVEEADAKVEGADAKVEGAEDPAGEAEGKTTPAEVEVPEVPVVEAEGKATPAEVEVPEAPVDEAAADDATAGKPPAEDEAEEADAGADAAAKATGHEAAAEPAAKEVPEEEKPLQAEGVPADVMKGDVSVAQRIKNLQEKESSYRAALEEKEEKSRGDSLVQTTDDQEAKSTSVISTSFQQLKDHSNKTKIYRHLENARSGGPWKKIQVWGLKDPVENCLKTLEWLQTKAKDNLEELEVEPHRFDTKIDYTEWLESNARNEGNEYHKICKAHKDRDRGSGDLLVAITSGDPSGSGLGEYVGDFGDYLWAVNTDKWAAGLSGITWRAPGWLESLSLPTATSDADVAEAAGAAPEDAFNIGDRVEFKPSAMAVFDRTKYVDEYEVREVYDDTRERADLARDHVWSHGKLLTLRFIDPKGEHQADRVPAAYVQIKALPDDLKRSGCKTWCQTPNTAFFSCGLAPKEPWMKANKEAYDKLVAAKYKCEKHGFFKNKIWCTYKTETETRPKACEDALAN